ncbi:unnamed protein product [Cochlearia groenlandica]
MLNIITYMKTLFHHPRNWVEKLVSQCYWHTCAREIADWLSQCTRKAGTGFPHMGTSSKKLRSHSASWAALSRAINSDSTVDLAMTVCLEDFQDTAAPAMVKTYPLVDFEFLESAIQLASLYPSKTPGSLP